MNKIFAVACFFVSISIFAQLTPVPTDPLPYQYKVIVNQTYHSGQPNDFFYLNHINVTYESFASNATATASEGKLVISGMGSQDGYVRKCVLSSSNLEFIQKLHEQIVYNIRSKIPFKISCTGKKLSAYILGVDLTFSQTSDQFTIQMENILK